MLLGISKKSGLHSETNKTNNINAKPPKKLIYYSINISISDYDFDYSLSGDSEWEEPWQPNEHKDINKLDQVVNDNIKKNKNQHNDAIEYDPRFDSNLVYL